MKMLRRLLVLAALLAPASLRAATFFLSPTGTDSGSCGSGAPCRTFSYAKSLASPGDDFTFKIGTYTATNITGFSGTSSNTSFVSCETDLGCLIDGNSVRTPVDITGAIYAYITITGFKLWGRGEFPSLDIESPDGTALANQSHHINVSTCAGYSEIDSSVNSAAWTMARLSSSSVYNIATIGGRYAFLGYGLQNFTGHRALISFKRWHPVGGQNPAGGLAVYDVHDSTFTHFFVYDTVNNTNGNALDKLGIYVVSNDNGNTAPFSSTQRIHFYAGAVINNGLGHCVGNEGGGSGGSNLDITFSNFLIAGCYGAGITVPNRATTTLFDHVTVTSVSWNTSDVAAYTGGGGNSVSGSAITSSNFYLGANDGLNGGWTNSRTNVNGFVSNYSGGASAGTGNTSANPNFKNVLVATNTTGAGLGAGGTDQGASLLNEYDDAGNATATKLWPWPNECDFKVFYASGIGLTDGVFATTYTYTQYFWLWKYGNGPAPGYDSTCGTPTPTPTAGKLPISTDTVNRTQFGVYTSTLFPPSDATNSLYNAELTSASNMGQGVYRSNTESGYWTEPLQNFFTLTQLKNRVAATTGTNTGQFGSIFVYEAAPSYYWNPPSGCPATFTPTGASIPCTRFYTTVSSTVYAHERGIAQQICSEKMIVKLGNEPDYGNYNGAMTTPTSSGYVTWASTVAKAWSDYCSSASIALGNIAFPTTYPASLGSGTWTGGSFFSEVYGDATLRSLIDYVSVDIYPSFSSHDAAISSMTGIMAAAGVQKPIIVFETSVTGGSPVTDNEYEKALYMTTVTVVDLGRYRWNGSSGVVCSFGHVLKQEDTQGFGYLDKTGAKLTVYDGFKNLMSILDGATYIQARDGGSVKAEQFRKDGIDRVIAWTDSGTGTLADLNISQWPRRARVTRYDGTSIVINARQWKTYPVGREPLVIQALTTGGTAGAY